MTATLRPPHGASCLLGAVVLLLFLAGCESDRGERHGGEARHHFKPPPPLAGQAVFFAGRITAELRTGAGFAGNSKGDDSAPAAGGEGRHGGGGGGFRMSGMGMGGGGGGGGRHGGGGGGGRGSDAEPSVDDSIDQDQAMNMRRAAANGGPPVTIHLRLTNNGTTPADVFITDFLSELGNFVVEPEKLSLAPGKSAEVEPMTSRLAGEISDASVTLTVRLDDHDEQKVIALHQVPSPSPDQPANPGPPAASPPAPTPPPTSPPPP